MKIAIFTDTFHPMINGVVTAICNIVEPLADKGHEFLIVTPKIGCDEEYSYPGVTVLRLSSFPARFYEDFRWTAFFSYSAYKALRRGGYEIVHFMTPFTVAYLGINLARMLDIPVVGTFHTFITDPGYSDQLFKGFLKPTDRMGWKYLSLFYNAADFVTAPSPSTLATLRNNGISSEGAVISNGIRMKGSSKKPTLAPTSRTVLCVGRLALEKNLFVLLDGFLKAWEKVPELHLLLVGDGPLKESLQAYVEDQNATESVTFAGKIPHDELMDSGIFEDNWVFATASATENQPMTLLEAQSRGMVCIGADARGIPDLICHEQNGLLFAPYKPEELSQRLLELHRDEDLYQRLRRQTRETVQIHEMSRVAGAWEELYHSISQRYAQGLIPTKRPLKVRNILACAKDLTISIQWKRRKAA